MTISMRFNLKFFRIFLKNTSTLKDPLFHFSPEKLVQLFLLENV